MTQIRCRHRNWNRAATTQIHYFLDDNCNKNTSYINIAKTFVYIVRGNVWYEKKTRLTLYKFVVDAKNHVYNQKTNTNQQQNTQIWKPTTNNKQLTTKHTNKSNKQQNMTLKKKTTKNNKIKNKSTSSCCHCCYCHYCRCCHWCYCHYCHYCCYCHYCHCHYCHYCYC